MFFAAWKAPRWVRETGMFALVFGLFSTFLGIIQVLGVMQQIENIETGVLCGELCKRKQERQLEQARLPFHFLLR